MEGSYGPLGFWMEGFFGAESIDHTARFTRVSFQGDLNGGFCGDN